ncbi:MAG: DUF2796 domain-containing protein [Sedimenticola sp.]
MNKRKLGVSLLALSISATIAASEHDHEHEQHEAHVHGEATLLIALEGKALEIEFLSPAMNIVGFEHQPTDKAQYEAVESAMADLKKADMLFTLPGEAGCTLESVEIDSALAGQEEEAHEHAHEHEHEKEHEEEVHSDFTGHYHFDCSNPDKISRIGVNIFEQFPGTEAIEVQSISKGGQQKIDLTPGNSTLDL